MSDARQDSPPTSRVQTCTDRLLAEMADILSSARPQNVLEESVLATALDVTNLESGFLVRARHSPGGVLPTVTRGCFADLGPSPHSSLEEWFERVLSRGQSVVIDDLATWSGRVPGATPGVAALAVLPVIAGRRVVAALGLGAPQAGFFREAVLRELDRVLRVAAVGLAATPEYESGASSPSGSGPPVQAATVVPAAVGGTERTLLDALSAVVWVKDRENRILLANRSAADALNLPLDEIEGNFLWELDPTNAAHSFRLDLDVIESGEPLFDQIEERRDLDGRHSWWSVDRTPLLDDAGDVCALVVVSRDVTERHVGRDRLEASQRTAQRADRIRSHTLAALAHEIRPSLERIEALAISHRDAEATPPSVWNELAGDASSVLAAVQDLIDFARVEASNQPVESTELSVPPLVEDLLDVLARDADLRGIALASHIDPSIPDPLFGDALRTRQVLLQLLAHALRAVDGGAVVCTARTVLQSDHRWEVRFEVRASSCPLSRRELETLFGPFVRGEDALDDDSRGRGFGLALAHRLVELLGGRVGVDLRQEGSFACWCTVAFEWAGERATEEDRVWPRPDARVLVVGPEPTVVGVIERQLQDLHLVVDIASGTEAARDMVEAARVDAWPYDACLVDADLDGPALRAWLLWLGADHERRERVVLVSGFGRREREDFGPRHRPDARIRRPIHRNTLGEVLAGLLGHDEQRGRAVDPLRRLDETEPVRDLRVLLLEADPLQQKLVATALRRLGCEVEVCSETAMALARIRDFDPALVFVDPSLTGPGGMDPVGRLRRSDAARGHRPVYALVEPDDLSARERGLAAGVDACVGRPPGYDELSGILSRHRAGVGVAPTTR